MEANTYWNPPADRKYIVDDLFLRHMETLMDESAWEILTEPRSTRNIQKAEGGNLHLFTA
jgi:hypothetical protein